MPEHLAIRPHTPYIIIPRIPSLIPFFSSLLRSCFSHIVTQFIFRAELLQTSNLYPSSYCQIFILDDFFLSEEKIHLKMFLESAEKKFKDVSVWSLFERRSSVYSLVNMFCCCCCHYSKC